METQQAAKGSKPLAKAKGVEAVAKDASAASSKKKDASAASSKKKDASAASSKKKDSLKLPGGVKQYSNSLLRKLGLTQFMERKKKKVKKTRRFKKKDEVKTDGKEARKSKKKKTVKRKLYPTEDLPKRAKYPKKRISHPPAALRKRITPGTVLILLAGRHRGKRVVFLKQLRSGLLLVTGPFRLNACPLRRINQIYVIATSTKLDISNMEIPAHLNDQYFRRKKPQKKAKKDDEIFETKKEVYTVSDKRRKDQFETDRQLLKIVHSHPEHKLMVSYLRSVFTMDTKTFPHKMRF